jgi:predicted DNA-binding protein (MmcQ/YjbR family)
MVDHPVLYDANDAIIDRIRAAIAHLPDMHEEETWGTLTFRVGRKLVGVLMSIGDAPHWLVFKPAEDERAALEADDRVCYPPYFKPWLAIDLDRVDDWQEVTELLTQSYLLVAPKALAQQVLGE